MEMTSRDLRDLILDVSKNDCVVLLLYQGTLEKFQVASDRSQVEDDINFVVAAAVNVGASGIRGNI